MRPVVKPALSQSPAVFVVAASVVTGVSLWLSRASFDVAGTADAPRRVAMFPSFPELAGLIVLPLLLSAILAWLMQETSRSSRSCRVPDSVDVILPVFSLGFLTLPYLPWLPDAVPALRLLAGPGLMLLWTIVVAQVALLLCSDVRERSPFLSSIFVFVASLAVYVWVFSRVESNAAGWLSFVVAAAVAALVWVCAFAVTNSHGAATFAWASVCLSAPFVLNSGDIVSAAFATFANPFRGGGTDGIANVWLGCLGLLFDQEYGVVAYAPVLLLGFIGLAGWVLSRSRLIVALALAASAFVVLLLGASRQPWWSESMMPGRTVLLLLPTLGPPIGWLYARTSARLSLRAAMQLLLLASLSVTLLLAALPDRVPMPQEADGSSSLLQWASPTWHLWYAAPTYLESSAGAASARVGIWLAGFAIAWLLFARLKITSPGRAALSTTAVAVVGCIGLAASTDALRSDSSPSLLDVDGRANFPMLETFDPTRRPVALTYSPLAIVDPRELPPLFSLAARPGERMGRQPLRVALNARFRLPAGDYEVDVTGSEVAGTVSDSTIALQIGREGRALETWPFAVGPGAHATYSFAIPIDAGFVGFRAARQVERTIAALRVRPLRIVEAGRRLRTPTVRSAAAFGPAKAFFHDADAYAEREGFWVGGRTTVKLTILKSGDGDLSLAVHSGARPNVLTLSSHEWSQRVELVPGVTKTVLVPSPPGELLVPLSITASDGFVPADVDPRSKDRRLLGAWIAVGVGS
jgi:hypothetical protein